MKKSLILMLLPLAAFVFYVSCAKAELLASEATPAHRLHFIVRSGETKSYLEHDSAGMKYLPRWNYKDSIGLFFVSASKPSSLDGVLVNSLPDGVVARFEGDVSAPLSEGEFYSFYPASRFYMFYASGQFGFNLGDPKNDYAQYPRKNSFDPACDFLLAAPCHYRAAGGQVEIDDLRFARMFSVLRINLKGTPVAGDSLSTFKISSSASVPLGGRVSVDQAGLSLGKWYVSRSCLTAQYRNRAERPELGKDAVYLVVNPQTLAKGEVLTIEAETNDKFISKTVTLNAPMTFPQGQVAVLNLTVREEDCSAKSAGWLEMPAKQEGSSYINLTMKADGARNYSQCYDRTMYAPVWSAYPLHPSHLSGSQKSSWKYNPDIDLQYQVGVTGASYGSNYNASEYARGHCVPNADREFSSAANAQTYYVTNQTPQVHNKFNSGIWSSLETAIRNVVTSYSDTVYVVTGPVYQIVGGSETIKYLSSATVNPASLPVPNYFWKAALKVRRSGGKVVSALAVGVWLEHHAYESKTDYKDYTVTVDQIEDWTGLDLFANLPASVQTEAEKNSDWSKFSDFK